MSKIKTKFALVGILCLFLPLLCRAEITGEVILDWKIYINRWGRYEIVYDPTQTNPYNWSAEKRLDYNLFELKRARVCWSKNFSSAISARVQALLEGEDGEINAQLEQGYFSLKLSQPLYFDLWLGYFYQPWYEWLEKNLWKWDMFIYPQLWEFEVMPRSELGIFLQLGKKSPDYEILFGTGYFSDQPNSHDQERFYSEIKGKASFKDFSFKGAFSYSFRGEESESWHQEIYTAGAGFGYQAFELTGEYFQGKLLVPEGELYLLGKFPQGLDEYLYLYGRTFLQKKMLEFSGYSLWFSIHPHSQLWLVWRYDYFDPTKEFEDDKENLFLMGIVYKPIPFMHIGVSFSRRNFQGTNIPDQDTESELEPIELITISLQAQIP